MAKLFNRTGKHIEYHVLVKGTTQGSGSMGPGESRNHGGGSGKGVKYWIRGNTSTSKT